MKRSLLTISAASIAFVGLSPLAAQDDGTTDTEAETPEETSGATVMREEITEEREVLDENGEPVLDENGAGRGVPELVLRTGVDGIALTDRDQVLRLQAVINRAVNQWRDAASHLP